MLRERRGGRRRHPRPAEAARRDRRRDGRAARRRRDGEALRRDGAGPGRRSTPPTPGTSTGSSKSRWTPCGCRRGDAAGRARSPAASGGASPCARCSCSSPTCCCSTSRRTTSTPRASPGSNATSREYPGTVVAVTHDRYFLDNVAKWILELDRGRGYPVRGQLLRLAGAEDRRRLAIEEKQETARQKTLARELEWARMAPRAGMAKSKARLAAIRQAAGAGDRRGREGTDASRSRPGRRWATSSCGPRASRRRYGDNLLFEDMTFDLPQGRHRRHHRPQRRRQDDALPDDRRPGEARRRQADGRRRR